MMMRREFITLLGGAAAAWPLAARAQQGERMRRIGVLMTLASDDPEGQTRLVAFVQGLQQLGWTVGRNMRIDTRWAAGDAERIRKYAAELVALSPDVILAAGGPTVGPMQQATRTVPIVFAIVTDPVGAGYVESLARPGGSVAVGIGRGPARVDPHVATDGPAQLPQRLLERLNAGLIFRIVRGCGHEHTDAPHSAGRCALAASGHPAAAPPSSVMKSRRLIRSNCICCPRLAGSISDWRGPAIFHDDCLAEPMRASWKPIWPQLHD